MPPTRTLVVHPHFKTRDPGLRSPAARLEEAVGLAGAIALDVRAAEVLTVATPRPATLFGSGQIERIGALAAGEETTLVVVDTALSPVQQRNLEKAWKAKVVDRTGLILEIFGAHARTHEGKLQVELAALEYQKSRLVRSWTHLERQRGGFGFLGGPGESQIELDRRLIRDRIDAIRRQLENVVRTRHLHRKHRQDVPFPTVALVGYTNAGKSTLFNVLTHAGILAEDKLFATLDPTIRKVTLPGGLAVMLSDTVGFISDLPVELIAAFRATLEEVVEANLLLHVRDMADSATEAQRQDVNAVLKQLFSNTETSPIVLEVHNKIDLLDAEARLLREPATGEDGSVAISAVTGEGIPELLSAIETELGNRFLESRSYRLPGSAGRAIAWLHAHSQIRRREEDADGNCHLNVRITPVNMVRFERLLQEERQAESGGA